MRAREFSKQIRQFQLQALLDANELNNGRRQLVQSIVSATQLAYPSDDALRRQVNACLRQYGHFFPIESDGETRLTLLVADRGSDKDLVESYEHAVAQSGIEDIAIIVKREEVTKHLHDIDSIDTTPKQLRLAILENLGIEKSYQMEPLRVRFAGSRDTNWIDILYFRLVEAPDVGMIVWIDHQIGIFQVQFMTCILPNFIQADRASHLTLANQMRNGADPSLDSRLGLIRPLVLRTIESLIQPPGSRSQSSATLL